MTFRSMAKRFFRVVLIALACFLALNVMMWSLYFGREGTDMRIELHRDSRCPSESGVRWLAVFPNELTPRKEGESLKIRFSVRGADSSSEINEIKLVFRSFSVCHYFNIFTDIT